MNTRFALSLIMILFLAFMVHAESEPEKGESGSSLKTIAAALAIGICGLGTAFAQARIGAAGVGAVSEKPETLGKIILLMALPETVVILGFVIAALLLI